VYNNNIVLEKVLCDKLGLQPRVMVPDNDKYEQEEPANNSVYSIVKDFVEDAVPRRKEAIPKDTEEIVLSDISNIGPPRKDIRDSTYVQVRPIDGRRRQEAVLPAPLLPQPPTWKSHGSKMYEESPTGKKIARPAARRGSRDSSKENLGININVLSRDQQVGQIRSAVKKDKTPPKYSQLGKSSVATVITRVPRENSKGDLNFDAEFSRLFPLDLKAISQQHNSRPRHREHKERGSSSARDHPSIYKDDNYPSNKHHREQRPNQSRPRSYVCVRERPKQGENIPSHQLFHDLSQLELESPIDKSVPEIYVPKIMRKKKNKDLYIVAKVDHRRNKSSLGPSVQHQPKNVGMTILEKQFKCARIDTFENVMHSLKDAHTRTEYEDRKKGFIF